VASVTLDLGDPKAEVGLSSSASKSDCVTSIRAIDGSVGLNVLDKLQLPYHQDDSTGAKVLNNRSSASGGLHSESATAGTAGSEHGYSHVRSLFASTDSDPSDPGKPNWQVLSLVSGEPEPSAEQRQQ
jgi:hypothetical protein